MMPIALTVPRRLAVTAAVALALIALAGCGSSTTVTVTKTTTTTPAAPTKEEFIAKADAICKETNANIAAGKNEVDAAQTALNGNDTPATRARLATGMRAVTKDQRTALDKLRALEAPPADRITISRFLDLESHQILLLESLASAIESNEVSRTQVLYREAETNVNKARGLAQGYGFRECASGSS